MTTLVMRRRRQRPVRTPALPVGLTLERSPMTLRAIGAIDLPPNRYLLHIARIGHRPIPGQRPPAPKAKADKADETERQHDAAASRHRRVSTKVAKGDTSMSNTPKRNQVTTRHPPIRQSSRTGRGQALSGRNRMLTAPSNMTRSSTRATRIPTQRPASGHVAGDQAGWQAGLIGKKRARRRGVTTPCLVVVTPRTATASPKGQGRQGRRDRAPT